MEWIIERFVEQGSYLLMILALLASGLGIPFPEDIVMISGAILAQRGITDLWLTVAALAFGVIVGDSMLYWIARRAGPAIYSWPLIRRVMPEARRRWLENMIAKHGGLVVFVARHVAGFRGPTFAICAIHGISYPRFIFWDTLALTISLPVWMALGWFFADSIEQLVENTATVERLFMLGALGVVMIAVLVHTVISVYNRRRAARASADETTYASASD